MAVISGCAYGYGNTARVFYASDYAGNNCGEGTTAEGVARGKYISYPRLTQDLAISLASGFDTSDIMGSIENFDLFGVCADSCPTSNAYVCTEVRPFVRLVICASRERVRARSLFSSSNVSLFLSLFLFLSPLRAHLF